MRRVWTVLLACYTVAVPVVAVLAGLGVTSGWPLCGEVPFGGLLWVAWFRWRTEFGRPRPDYALIAELERTELGIDPRSERRPDCRHEHPHEIVRVSGRVDRLCLDCGISLAFKPQPPAGRGAGSPTVR